MSPSPRCVRRAFAYVTALSAGLNLAGMDLAVAADFSAFDRVPNRDWVVRLPGGRLAAGSHVERSAPVIEGDAIYVGSAAGRSLYALSSANGFLRRAYPAEGSVESSPTVVGDRLYFGDTGGTVNAYEKIGTKLWTHQTEAPILVAPTVRDGTLFVSNVRDLAVALDEQTGNLLWQYQRRPALGRGRDLALYASAPATIVGSDVIFGFSDGAVVAVDRVRGDVSWEVKVGEGRYPDVVAAPVDAGGALYVSGYYGPLMAIDLETRVVRWRAESGAAFAVAVTVVGDVPLVVQPGTDGKLRAFDTRNGSQVWEWNSGTDGALTTPLVTPAGLVVGSSDGGLWLIDELSGNVRWTDPDPVLLAGLDAVPAIEGRQMVFVTSAGRIHSTSAVRGTDGADYNRAGVFQWKRDASGAASMSKR